MTSSPPHSTQLKGLPRDACADCLKTQEVGLGKLSFHLPKSKRLPTPSYCCYCGINRLNGIAAWALEEISLAVPADMGKVDARCRRVRRGRSRLVEESDMDLIGPRYFRNRGRIF